MHWHIYKDGLTGELHWAWDNCGVDNGNVAQPGDVSIVYPDPENAAIISSLRQIASRDGAEDYELFKILEAKNPELAKKLVNISVKSATVYTENGADIIRIHDALVRAAAGENAEIPL